MARRASFDLDTDTFDTEPTPISAPHAAPAAPADIAPTGTAGGATAGGILGHFFVL